MRRGENNGAVLFGQTENDDVKKTADDGAEDQGGNQNDRIVYHKQPLFCYQNNNQ
jgi:hypothetical protein